MPCWFVAQTLGGEPFRQATNPDDVNLQKMRLLLTIHQVNKDTAKDIAAHCLGALYQPEIALLPFEDCAQCDLRSKWLTRALVLRKAPE